LMGDKRTAVLKLDTTKKPKEIDLEFLPYNDVRPVDKDPPWRAIYKVEGDTLTMCFNVDTTLPRPDEFRTQADSARLLFVYKRARPNDDPKKAPPKNAARDATKGALQNLQGTRNMVAAERHGKGVQAKDLPAEEIVSVLGVASGVQKKPKAAASPSGILFWQHDARARFDVGLLYAIDPKEKTVTQVTKKPIGLSYNLGFNEDGKVCVGESSMFPVFVPSRNGRSVAIAKDAYAEVKDGDVAKGPQVNIREIDQAGGSEINLKLDASPLCWSSDDRQLIVAHRVDNSIEHFLVDLKTKKHKPIPLPKVDAPQGATGLIGRLITDWSRDGQWFLTTCYRGGKEKPHVYRVKRDGSEAIRLKTIQDGEWGRFSPEGTRVLYAGHDAKGRTAVMVADVAGSKPARLSQEQNGSIDPTGFCWSPDGKRVAYLWSSTERPPFGERHNEEYETFIIVIDADGQNPVTVFSEKTRGTVRPIRWPEWR
jgi:hypothetical protein